MKRVPLVVVAVLVAMVATAAVLKWRAARAPAVTYVRTVDVTSSAAPRAGTAPQPSSPDGAPAWPGLASGGARMLHGAPTHVDRSAAQAPRSEPQVAWRTRVGGPVEAQVTASPDEQTLYVASLGGTLTALGRADGAVKWTVDLHERAYATPCVADDGTIYAGSDAKKLLALSPDGHTRWSLDAEDEVDTAPVLAPDGTVVFAAGRKVWGVTPLGYVRWRFAAKRKVFAGPAVGADGRVFVGSQDHHVYALTPEGGPAWSVDLGADVDGAPVVADDGAVYVGTDGGEVVRFDPADGRVVWRASLGGYVRGTLSLTRAGGVLAGVYGPAPREVMLDAADGAVLLSFPIQGTGAREFGVHGGALEDGAGLLLFGAQDDDVY